MIVILIVAVPLLTPLLPGFGAEAIFDIHPNSGKTERVERNGKDISQVTTKFLVMNAGRLVFEGSESELQASQDPYVRKFVREGGA